MADGLQPGWLDTFAQLPWASKYLNSKQWRCQARQRNTAPDDDADRFNRDTMSAYNGVQTWVELYEKPAEGSTTVQRSVSLIKFGTGLNGFPGIAHGGATMTLMDEALAFAMIASETEKNEGRWLGINWECKKLLEEGKPIAEVLAGYMVTAKLDMKFLKPVLCPGVVGVEVETIEDKGHKMRMRGVMKDGNGTPLIQADGLWIRMGGGPKL
ncbi:HotDog domain-containing protein [Lophiotrema nucula]|uniref:HotDog domain-containing protein n=1 Tax=Lophiotrema nucula TaxID=690887 RepID=A0A6A5ZBH7_9PLEO|nr:HotDog domain-containing protein [Lophiotrema nucula]